MPGGCISLFADTDSPLRHVRPPEPYSKYSAAHRSQYAASAQSHVHSAAMGYKPASMQQQHHPMQQQPASSTTTTTGTTPSTAAATDAARLHAAGDVATSVARAAQAEVNQTSRPALGHQVPAAPFAPELSTVASRPAAAAGLAPAEALQQQTAVPAPPAMPAPPAPAQVQFHQALPAPPSRHETEHANHANLLALAPAAMPPQAVVPVPAPMPEPIDAVPKMPTNWSRGKLIGAGAFGQVYLARDNLRGNLFAVKQVALTKDEHLRSQVASHIRALEAEVKVLRQLRHTHIVQYIGTERTGDTLNIFLEYVAGGSIASNIDKFGPLEETLVKIYTKQILKGLEYLHEKRIMHRDIKGANVLVDTEGVVKLADFGASKKIEELASVGTGSVGSKAMSIKGTPYWMAPEIIKQEGHGRPADIWSLGCCVIEMATGLPPWSDKHKNPVAAMYYCASTGVKPDLPRNELMPHGPWSAEARDFLSQCFERVPKNRPNATQLLMHPWLAGVVVPSGRPAMAQLPAQVRYPHSPIKEEDAPSPPVAAASAMTVPVARPQAARALAPQAGFAEGEAGWRGPAGPAAQSQAPRQADGTLKRHDAGTIAGVGAPALAPQLQQQGPSHHIWGNDTLDAAVDAEMANMASVRASMLTMNFNPMEEPSWLPNAQQAQMLAAATQRPVPQLPPLHEEASDRSPRQAGQLGGTAASRVPPLALDRATSQAAADDGAAVDSYVVVQAQPRLPAGSPGAKSRAPPVVPPLPRLSQLMNQAPVSQMAAMQPVAASVNTGAVAKLNAAQEEKHKKWLEELIGEMNNKRQEQAQQRASAIQPL